MARWDSIKARSRLSSLERRSNTSSLMIGQSESASRKQKGIKVQDDAAMKAMLHRIVAMLTRMAMKFDGVAEQAAEYDAEIDYEHRCAEHEHESQTEESPEPWDATERRW